MEPTKRTKVAKIKDATYTELARAYWVLASVNERLGFERLKEAMSFLSEEMISKASNDFEAGIALQLSTESQLSDRQWLCILPPRVGVFRKGARQ